MRPTIKYRVWKEAVSLMRPTIKYRVWKHAHRYPYGVIFLTY